MNEVEDFYLQHYGVKGMKWGVRKKASSAGRRVKNRAKREYGSFKRERSQLKIKDPGQMTDRELKSTLKRNKLENQLKEESRKTPGIGKNRGEEHSARRKANRDTYLDRGQLSNKELKAKVDRIRSENQLVQEANKINRKTLETGSSFMAGVGSSLLKDAASGRDYSTGQMMTNALISGSIDAAKTYVKETKSEKNRYDKPYG